MNQLHLLNAGQRLPEALAGAVRTTAQGALERHAAALGLDGLDVVVYCTPWTIPETGISGTAPDGYGVLVGLTPDNPHFAACWPEELRATLAHELHHAARWRAPGFGTTLLGALVSEGLAQHQELTERTGKPIYAHYDGDLKAFWKRAQPHLHGPYDYQAWFLGSEAAALPRWGGYALGFELVRRFLAKEGGTAASHAHTPAEAFAHAWPV